MAVGRDRGRPFLGGRPRSVSDPTEARRGVLSHRGDLAPIAGSIRPLSGAGTGPAQIEFNPEGNVLVVTEKNTNLILTYTVDDDGLASGPATHASAGMTPFGFAFGKRDHLIVSEAFGGAPNASAMSSYSVSSGAVTTVSASVATTEPAACWAVISNNGRFAYTTSTGSGSVTGYSVSDGSADAARCGWRDGCDGTGQRTDRLGLQP